MGRLAQGHFDDVFLDKIKQVCIHVLDQLNHANEIEQAFDLCPSISRRNRVILNFLRDADHIDTNFDSSARSAAASASASPPSNSLHPSASTRYAREPSTGTDSVASLSAQRRRRATEMQYVRDPNDSNDDSDLQAIDGPSSSARHHLNPASARVPSMSQPDYTFEQFADHLDPTDKLLKRSFEIIIKETARQALAKKRDPDYDPATASARSSLDSTASLRSAIASSRDRIAALNPLRDNSTRRVSRLPHPATSARRRNLDHPDRASDAHAQHQPLPALDRDIQARPSHWRDLLLSGNLPNPSWNRGSSSQATWPIASPSLRHVPNRFLDALISSSGSQAETSGNDTANRHSPFAGASMQISPQLIDARLAEASRRNAQAARTIGDAERLRSSQFIRTSIESLRASLFQLHIDLACAQLQQTNDSLLQRQQQDSAADIGTSFALVMDTIELFDDTLRRLSCLVSNNDVRGDPDTPSFSQTTTSSRTADTSQMRTSLWRARNLLLLSSMTRRSDHSNASPSASETLASASQQAELAAHLHFIATMEESHWARPDTQAPTSQSIGAWRRKLAAWYHLDRDRSQCPDPPHAAANQQQGYARWHPDLEMAYALDDEILAPMRAGTNTARPDPIADPRAAWQYARSHDPVLAQDLNHDAEICSALETPSVCTALRTLLRLRSENQASSDSSEAQQDAGTTAASSDVVQPSEADPDVSLTRTTSLRRRNAVRGLGLTNSDSSSIRSARSTLSRGRALDSGRTPSAQEQAQAEEDGVDDSLEMTRGRPSDVGQQSHDAPLLRPSSDRRRGGRSGSFTFVTTPAAVLRSGQRSRSQDQETNLEAEEYTDVDLDDEDAFDFDLVAFLSRRRRSSDDAEAELDELTSARLGRRRSLEEDASRSGVRVVVSASSGTSTPAEARQATFEAYAQRARLLERRRRLARQSPSEDDGDSPAGAAHRVDADSSQRSSPESSRRRRRPRNLEIENLGEESSTDQRNLLPFPRTWER